MSAKEIIKIAEQLEQGAITNYYSAHGLRGSQRLILKSKGIKFEQRHVGYKKYELDFSK